MDVGSWPIVRNCHVQLGIAGKSGSERLAPIAKFGYARAARARPEPGLPAISIAPSISMPG